LSNLKSTLKFELRFDNFLKVVKSEIKLIGLRFDNFLKVVKSEIWT